MRALLALLLLALPAAADPAREATGRLAVTVTEARPNCTAVLVAPHRALSAGHCVGRAPNPQQKFFADWQPDGSFDAALPVAGFERVEATPLLTPETRDVVVIDLAPRADAPAPLPFGPAPAPGETVRVISYPRNQAPRDTRCTVTARSDAILSLDCPATSGMSGAPVLVETRDGWAVAAILTARSGQGSLALLVDDALAGD
ncbi:trypsin-like peptidase [Palleronia aestuarii]|uniref:Trypsin-like peptidase n=1 Tax=Palleronia aestuarii TaxID=568105 RepID=A0A2W7NWB5_9RHOB|nr:serine protease [Palleronia aestuarii]PZX17596.1 trypsin-like peptidase [Palleronia aestuarii]